jgi:hypothetical protein
MRSGRPPRLNVCFASIGTASGKSKKLSLNGAFPFPFSFLPLDSISERNHTHRSRGLQ